MDYETGVPTSPSDIIAKLATFAAGNGWTVSTVTNGRVFRLESVVVGVSSFETPPTAETKLYAKGATAYGGGAWDAQTNPADDTVIIDVGAGPFTAYHFFVGDEDGSQYLHAVIEIGAGVYRHLAFGELVKFGTYTGGVYVDGVRWPNGSSQNAPESTNDAHLLNDAAQLSSQSRAHVWADYDAKANNWQGLEGGDAVVDPDKCCGSVRLGGINYPFTQVSYQRWNLRSPMAPLIYFANRASSFRSPVGRIPHARLIGMQTLAPGEVITVGSDDWMVFPAVQRTDVWNQAVPPAPPSSGYYGYAYRR